MYLVEDWEMHWLELGNHYNVLVEECSMLVVQQNNFQVEEHKLVVHHVDESGALQMIINYLVK